MCFSFLFAFTRSNCQLPGCLLFPGTWTGNLRKVYIRLHCDIHILETCNQIFLHRRCCEINSLPLQPNPRAVFPSNGANMPS